MTKRLDPLDILLRLAETDRQNCMMAMASVSEKKKKLENKLLEAKRYGQQLLQQRQAALIQGIYPTELSAYDVSINEQKKLLEQLHGQMESLNLEDQALLKGFLQIDSKRKGLEKTQNQNLERKTQKIARTIQQGMDDMAARRVSRHQ